MEDFERSTQARRWTFDSESLEACRRQAVERSAVGTGGLNPTHLGPPSPRKFASGFHSRYKDSLASELVTDAPMYSLSTTEQELLVRFHAHQIQSLVGPEALLPGLQTNESVTLTAITLFRRFYLSNSVAEIHPRKIAVASAFLASKVEEDRVEVSCPPQSQSMYQFPVNFGDTSVGCMASDVEFKDSRSCFCLS
jgi:cyclin H